MSSAKCRSSCLGLNVLTLAQHQAITSANVDLWPTDNPRAYFSETWIKITLQTQNVINT